MLYKVAYVFYFVNFVDYLINKPCKIAAINVVDAAAITLGFINAKPLVS